MSEDIPKWMKNNKPDWRNAMKPNKINIKKTLKYKDNNKTSKAVRNKKHTLNWTKTTQITEMVKVRRK